jgi:hypothetical protein
MKNIEQTLKRIRKAESQLAYADPKKAAKLASTIVRLKATVFDRD